MAWLGEQEIVSEASIAAVTSRTLVLRTTLKRNDEYARSLDKLLSNLLTFRRVLVQGFAVLVIIDTKLKKAIIVPEENRARLLVGAVPIDVPAPALLPSIVLTDPAVISSTFFARYSDMDSNRHSGCTLL